MEQARRSGDLSYSVGKVDPEIDGHTGKGWSNDFGSAPLSAGFGGTSAAEVGGIRESTRGMGNTTTQTERGYDHPVYNVAPGLNLSQAEPLQRGDLATGGGITHIGDGAEVSPQMRRWLAAGGRAILGSLVPGASAGFMAARQFMPDQNPFQNTTAEEFIGRKPVEGPVAPDRLPYRVRRQNRNRD